MIILGIDPGLAIVGYGVIEAQKGAFRPIDCGVINTPKSDTVPIRLNKIYDGMLSLIEKYKPDCIAIEELFFNTNITTGINVAQARGVVLLACQQKGLKMYEYTPLQIKQALTGYGKAEKKTNTVYGYQASQSKSCSKAGRCGGRSCRCAYSRTDCKAWRIVWN